MKKILLTIAILAMTINAFAMRSHPKVLKTKDIEVITLAEKLLTDPVIVRRNTLKETTGIDSPDIMVYIIHNKKIATMTLIHSNVVYNIKIKKISRVNIFIKNKTISYGESYTPEQLRQIPKGRRILQKIYQLIQQEEQERIDYIPERAPGEVELKTAPGKKLRIPRSFMFK